MSGPAPETERERLLRQLAGRLLTWPDPEGPATADLTVGYPDELPPELVDRTELRFLGSVVRRRAGELVGAEMIFDGVGDPDAVAADYATILVGLGWERIEQPRPPSGGFQHRAMMGSTLLVAKGESALVYVHAADREDGGAELRVRYDPVHGQDVMANIRRGTQYEESVLPDLKPPPGVKLQPEGTGGGGGTWRSDARAHTEIAPTELEAYFAKQLEAAGWGRVSGSADDSFAWSSWLVPSVPPAREWRGVLLVLAAFPGWRKLSLQAELIAPVGNRAAPSTRSAV
ncbi:MAG: hypothetical protein E6I86_12020 [Chloroflexi bacterium]|nr:MAG: hypothetical protein E6I86_12020 [Chloroflexota bacterium]